MTDDATTEEDPAVVGVPPETPDAVRPSATGLVTGPVDGETDVEIAEVDAPGSSSQEEQTNEGVDVDQVLQDAEGGMEGSALDAPPDMG